MLHHMILESVWKSMQKSIGKIGILTFHNAHNFGAMLQAYALKTFLINQGYNAEIVNYRNTKIEKKYSRHLSSWFAVRKRDWIMPWRWKNLIHSWKWSRAARPDWQVQYRRFSNFEHRYLVSGKPIVKRKIKTKPYKCLIYGSDQIWDLGITGKRETVYWGTAAPKGCRNISYGASIYSKELSDCEKRNAKKYLDSFYSLTVRETTLAEQLGKLLNCNVETVSDPTLLIPIEEYLKVIEENPYKEKYQKSYTLVYLVSESADLIQIAQKNNLPVKVLRYYTSIEKEKNVEEIADAGPIEFLNLIYHADYVVTNSFHGCVFSLLFQKKLCAVYKQNTRIENLLAVAGMNQAHVKNAAEFKKENFLAATKDNLYNLELYAEKSKEYLYNALK